MIPGHLWTPAVKAEADTPSPPKGFEYVCVPCDIRGWDEAPSAEDLRCWSCDQVPSSSRGAVGVHGRSRMNPDIEDGSPDRALWI